MSAAKRYDKIMELLIELQEISVVDLSTKLAVTGKTIRQDLEKLESMGQLRRTHGGAILANEGYYGILSRISPNAIHLEAKVRLAKTAMKLIEANDIIALDGGSTTLEMAKLLENAPLTVITNDLHIISELIKKDQIRLVVPGGHRYRNALVHEEPLLFYNKLNVQKAFLSTTGIHLDYGLTIFTNMHVEQKRALIDSAQHVYCVADHSKFDKCALLTFAKLDEIHLIVTDDQVTVDTINKYNQAGVAIANN